VNNLEWCTPSQNTNHAFETGLNKPATIRVAQYDLNNNLIAEFDSVKEASEKTGCSAKKIPSVCRGKAKTCGGFIWKYIDKVLDENIPDGLEYPGFPNYLILSDGRIYSKNYKQYMQPNIRASGYLSIKLCNDGAKQDFGIHQLVAKVYIPNPDEKSFVNHKNMIKDDNRVENLEWCTSSENMIHANITADFAFKAAVIKCDLRGNLIEEYFSIRNATELTGVDSSSIVRVCKNKQGHAGGFLWKYKIVNDSSSTTTSSFTTSSTTSSTSKSPTITESTLESPPIIESAPITITKKPKPILKIVKITPNLTT
jgi:hypothetical protein